jgi:hypothetical protein
MTAALLVSQVQYSGAHKNASWCGRAVVDENRFKSYIANRVQARVEDAETQDPFEAEVRGMATTGRQTNFVESLLRAVPAEKSWGIGEALAECVLANDDTREICWPWNLGKV